MQFYASFHHWIYISRVQYPSTADILVMENTVSFDTLQSTVLLECVQLNSLFITVKLYFSFTDLNRVSQK